MFVLGSAVIYVLPVMVSAFKGGGMEPITAWRIAFAVFAVIGAICCIIPAHIVKEEDYIDTYTTKKVPMLESFKAAFSYKHYVIMTIGYLFMQAGFSFFNGACIAYVVIYSGIYFYEPISNFFGTQPIEPGFIASLAG